MTHIKEATKISLGHMPQYSHWVFDQSVADVFSDMLQRSIPLYDVMRQTVYDIGLSYVQPQTEIVDLGCSLGDALAPFIECFDVENSYWGIDVSEPMLEIARKRFEKQINAGVVRLTDTDLRAEYPKVNASLTLCVLTLQFTPIDYRQRILKEVYNHTVPGGALILVEKVLGQSAEFDNMMVRHYHKLKQRNGYSLEEIETKRQALEGVLVPVTARMNERMLIEAGFQEVECFWRWMNFAGWLAVKR